MAVGAQGTEAGGDDPRPSASAEPFFADLGSHHHAITTAVAATQRYFDQGLTLVYAFEHEEAIRSFQAGLALDPGCAMCWWGVALALGPNINRPMPGADVSAAWQALRRAQDLAPGVTPDERAYVEALATRYRPDAALGRQDLDRAYAAAMGALAARHPDDEDAATLHAEALMDTMPWNYWEADGRPRPGTGTLVATLERVLRRDPDHPGANHYYIHAIEASPMPERGLASARRLPRLVPGAGHLVHMPSHIYLRLGMWAEASAANEQAIRVDDAYLREVGARPVYERLYYPHNWQFLTYSAAMQGRSAVAIEAARTVADLALAPAMGPPDAHRQWAAATYPATLARFGRWSAILVLPPPPPAATCLRSSWHAARGLALAATGESAAAAAELDAQRRLATSAAMRRLEVPGAYCASEARVAGLVLEAALAGTGRRPGRTIGLLTAAAAAEDRLPSAEPPLWLTPVRLSLGAARLAAGDAAGAEATYRQDLDRHPDNGWALHGLMQALRAQGHDGAAAEVERRFRLAWADADVVLSGSTF